MLLALLLSQATAPLGASAVIVLMGLYVAHMCRACPSAWRWRTLPPSPTATLGARPPETPRRAPRCWRRRWRPYRPQPCPAWAPLHRRRHPWVIIDAARRGPRGLHRRAACAPILTECYHSLDDQIVKSHKPSARTPKGHTLPPHPPHLSSTPPPRVPYHPPLWLLQFSQEPILRVFYHRADLAGLHQAALARIAL